MQKPQNINAMAQLPTKGRVKLLHALPYLGWMVYVLQIDADIFTYHVVINDQMYFSYVEGVLPKGKKKFTQQQIKNYVGVVLATAHTTVETVTGLNNKTEQELGRTVINAGETVFGNGKKV